MVFLNRIALVLATGYVAFFFGERVFWSLPHATDTMSELIITWLLYSLFAYVCLVVIESFKVRSIWSIFLIGALLGWLVEGVFSLTTFGVNFPFPLSISWTALAWHAPAFLLGWYLVLRALATSTTNTLLASIVIGVFWGTWALAWPVNGDESYQVSSNIFLINGLVCTALYIVALNLYRPLGINRFVSTKAEKIVLALIVLTLFATHTVPNGGFILPLTLIPALFGVIYLGLRKNKKVETEDSVFMIAGEKFPIWRSLLLLAAPVIATLIFSSGLYVNTNMLYAFILIPLGTFMFALSLYKVLTKKQTAPTVLAPTPSADTPLS